MEKAKTYLRGLGLLLVLILVGIVGFIAIGLITLSVFIVLLIIFIGVAIIALLLTPYYYAKDFEVKSKDFKLKKIKKKEKM
jgi:hypothetical protein